MRTIVGPSKLECTAGSGPTTRSDRELDDAMKPRVLPKIPDLEIDSEAVHTWNIENYRHLSKKERGPKFDCGGHPWYVTVNSCLSPLRKQANIPIGKFFFFPLVITPILHPFTWSKDTMRTTSQRKAGMHVPSSRWFYGIRRTPRFT